MLKLFKNFWDGESGAQRILSVAFPLILSASSFTIMQFADRKFLLMYSPEAFQAAAPAGMLAFTFMSLFFGTTIYTNTFVAQYFGAGQNKKVGASVWQGIYFALFAWPLMLIVSLFSTELFEIAAHPLSIRPLEADYFRIITYGSVFVFLNLAMSSFFSGREKTKVVMWIRFLAVFINIPLNYCMIFGKLGMPEMGIKGAAWATVISTASSTVLFAFLLFSKQNRLEFNTLRGFRFDSKLFARLLRFGLPNGVGFVIDVFAFSFFFLIIGRLGKIELAATNAAWSLNSLAFMPMFGMVLAVSTIVGQAVSKKRIVQAKLAVRNSFTIAFLYMATFAIAFVTIPELCLWPLFSGANNPAIAQIIEMSVVFLRFVALYSLFLSISMVFSSAIKGAGDTRFVMWATFFSSITFLILPIVIISKFWEFPATTAWSFLTLYVIAMAIITFLRFKNGKWEKMQVIERSALGDSIPIDIDIAPEIVRL